MVKETEKFDQERRVRSTCLPISGWFPKETLGASWHWQVGINPRQVFAISRMRLPRNRRAGLLTCFAQSVSQAHHIVKYSGKRVR